MTRKSNRVKYANIPQHDTGIAEAFYKATRTDGIDRLTYIEEKEHDWMIWNGQAWQPDNGAGVRNAIDLFISELPNGYEKFRNHFKLNAVEKRLRDILQKSIKDFDSYSNLITLNNCTLDVITGEPLPHLPEHRITKTLDFDYGDLEVGSWNKFVFQVFKKSEIVRAIQVLMGYSLFTPGNPENLFIVIKGASGTGKGTFLETIANIFPHMTRAIRLSVFRDKQQESARSDVVAAMTARIAFSNETSAAWELHADQLKRFTGYEKMSTRELWGKEFDAKPECVPVIATNHFPTIKGADKAVRRRLLVVPVAPLDSTRRVERGLSDRLARDCASEVLQWLLEGYWKYLESGLDFARHLFQKVTDKAYGEASIYIEFMNDCSIPDTKAVEPVGDIADKFQTWLIESGEGVGRWNNISLGKELTNIGWEVGPRRNHGKTRTRIGRRLK